MSNKGTIHKVKAKKVTPPRLDKAFISLRKQLEHRYMADLKELLPGVSDKRIWYAMEVRCRNSKLKEEVKNAMSQLALNTRERWQKLEDRSIL